MRTIFKYSVEPEINVSILMPREAQILSVQVQRERICIWAIVETENERVEHRFKIYGTGHPLEDNEGLYLGTFQLAGGAFIGHIFEEIK